MHLVVISPETLLAGEDAVLGGLLESGLERYHVRKPRVDRGDLERWLTTLPAAWLPRLVLHQHHDLAAPLGIACHEPDRDVAAGGFSRSCHTLTGLRGLLGRYAQVFFGPVFASLSKPGYGPAPDMAWTELSALLHARPLPGSTRVLAIGGVTADRLARCAELGFDGAALMGAVWSAPDPVAAFRSLRDQARSLAVPAHGA